eukprot:EG_transcript_12381
MPFPFCLPRKKNVTGVVEICRDLSLEVLGQGSGGNGAEGSGGSGVVLRGRGEVVDQEAELTEDRRQVGGQSARPGAVKVSAVRRRHLLRLSGRTWPGRSWGSLDEGGHGRRHRIHFLIVPQGWVGAPMRGQHRL